MHSHRTCNHLKMLCWAGGIDKELYNPYLLKLHFTHHIINKFRVVIYYVSADRMFRLEFGKL